MMERNLDILEQQGKIHRNKVPNEEKTMNVIILEPGIRDVDNDFKEFNYSPPIQIGAYHHYDAKTSGTGSPIIINSQNISVVNKLFDNLAQEIRNSHNLINKEVLLEEVKAAKELANRNEPSD